MRHFEHIAPNTLNDALAALSNGDHARILAGGTDLLGEMKRGVISPDRVVSLKAAEGLDAIRQQPDGTLTIGARVTLDQVAEHPLVARHCPMLTQATRQTASPQIRNVATLGGNLCQRPRCTYYRHPDFPCIRKHGGICYAVEGQNRYHAIFGGYRCFFVHPSDTAPALMALNAQVQIVHANGTRTVSLSEFFVGPRENHSQENTLSPHEILTEIQIPPAPPGALGTYIKVAERQAVDFALVSIALHLARQEGRVSYASIVLGGVAPVPWRLPQVESLLTGRQLTDGTILRACEIAAEGAHPMRHNTYKVSLVKGILKKALHRLRG